MGVSTDGILFWGFSAEDADYEPWCPKDSDEEVEWIDIVAKSAGVEITGWEDRFEYEKYLNFDIGWHGSDSYSIPFFYLKKYYYRCSRGQVVDIPDLSEPNEEEKAEFKDICLLLNIEWQEPGWKLVSYYG